MTDVKKSKWKTGRGHTELILLNVFRNSQKARCLDGVQRDSLLVVCSLFSFVQPDYRTKADTASGLC